MFALVTGGSASGKSALAEELVCKLGNGKRLYIATMEPMDMESLARIERHHKLRAGKGFDTLEYYTDFKSIQLDRPYRTVLLECMSNLLANEMFSQAGAGADWKRSILTGVDYLLRQSENTVIVTNEIFTDGAMFDSSVKEYVENLGKLNCLLVERADVVIEAVCSIPVVRKGDNIYESCI